VLLTARPPTGRQERLFGDDPATTWGAAAPVTAPPAVERERSSHSAVADAPPGGVADAPGSVGAAPAGGIADERAATVADEPAAAVADAPTTAAEEPRAPATAGPTLAAAITSLWDRLTAAQPAACPVCDAPIEPRHAAGGVVGGRCRSCGSTLA
jgi:hypothetical protein